MFVVLYTYFIHCTSEYLLCYTHNSYIAQIWMPFLLLIFKLFDYIDSRNSTFWTINLTILIWSVCPVLFYLLALDFPFYFILFTCIIEFCVCKLCKLKGTRENTSLTLKNRNLLKRVKSLQPATVADKRELGVRKTRIFTMNSAHGVTHYLPVLLNTTCS